MRSLVVVKIGGGPTISYEAAVQDIAALFHVGTHVVIVHGGRSEIDRVLGELGRAPVHAISPSGTSARLTDDAALDGLFMALAGRVKPRLITLLNACGLSAVGLTGIDGRTISADRKRALKVVEHDRVRVVRNDRSGVIRRVDPSLILALLQGGFTPVLSPPADGAADGPLNVDADRVAAAVATALRADALVFLTDVAGLFRHPDDPSSLLRSVSPAEFDELHLGGGMRQKLCAAFHAHASGVKQVVLADGRTNSPLSAALAGAGTTVRQERSNE